MNKIIEIVSKEKLTEREKLGLFINFENYDWVSTGETNDGKGRVDIGINYTPSESDVAFIKWSISTRKNLAKKFGINNQEAWEEYQKLRKEGR